MYVRSVWFLNWIQKLSLCCLPPASPSPTTANPLCLLVLSRTHSSFTTYIRTIHEPDPFRSWSISVSTHCCLAIVVTFHLFVIFFFICFFFFGATPFYVSLGNLLPCSTAISTWSGSVTGWSRVIQWQRQRRTDTHFVTKKINMRSYGCILWFSIFQRNALEIFESDETAREWKTRMTNTDTFFFFSVMTVLSMELVEYVRYVIYVMCAGCS